LYIPNLVDYSDYDFKNLQSIEMLEDIFWESSILSYNQDDYNSILRNTKDNLFFDKEESFFNNNKFFKNKKIKQGVVHNSFLYNNLSKTNLNTLPIFIEDSFLNLGLLNHKNTKPLSLEFSFDLLENLFDNFKYMHYIYGLNFKNTLNINNNLVNNISYTSVIDMFTSNFEENN